MSLADDLLEQAEHLAARDPTRPKQASLRRSISTAYYALFHLLVGEASGRLAPGAEFRDLTARAFNHGEMKAACQAFARGNLPPHLAAAVGPPVPADLQRVAGTFVSLQEWRHLADYAPGRRFTRANTVRQLRDTREAFESWVRVKAHPVARVFLTALLIWERLRRG